jgi:hypothetical protein
LRLTNLKSAQNLKYSQKKKERGEDGESHANDADQVLVLMTRITAVQKDPTKENFLKHLILSSVDGGRPYAMAFTKSMMIGVSGNCTTFSVHPSVVSFDKTFNACKAQLTLMIYQNKNLIREATGTHPIFLGAAFIHWQSDSKTFHGFMKLVKDQLKIKGQPIIGSDDELALTKAIEEVFTDNIFLTCTRHLEGNASDHLEKKQKITGKEKDTIIHALFKGSNCLTSSPSQYEFNKRELELATLYKSAFQPAYWDYLMVRIKERIVIPSIQTSAAAKGKWTNNQCESWNSLLKTDINWQKLKLPDLLDHLERLGLYEENEVKAAIFGQGGLKLAPHMAKYQVTPAEWDKMTPAQKEARYHRVLKGPQLREAPESVISTNGALEMTPTPTVCRKANQKTRGTPNRTYSQAKKTAKKTKCDVPENKFDSLTILTDAIKKKHDKKDEKSFSELSDMSIDLDLNSVTTPEKSIQNLVKKVGSNDLDLINTNSEEIHQKDTITSPEKSVQSVHQDLFNEDPFDDDSRDPDYNYPVLEDFYCEEISIEEEQPSKRQRTRPRYLSDYDD